MDWYLDYSGTIPVSSVKEKLDVPNYDCYIFLLGTPEFKYVQLKRGGGGGLGIFRLSFRLINQPFLKTIMPVPRRAAYICLLGTESAPLHGNGSIFVSLCCFNLISCSFPFK
jgi:hypothetical protein